MRDPKSGTNFTMDVPEDRYIFWAFEDAGVDLPLINGHRMCRNGACTTCAVKVCMSVGGGGNGRRLVGLGRRTIDLNPLLTCIKIDSNAHNTAGRGQGEDGGRAGAAAGHEGALPVFPFPFPFTHRQLNTARMYGLRTHHQSFPAGSPPNRNGATR